MTAEVAIINRFGIALAADSAVTIGDERVWKTTNKLFSLSPNHDVGIMIFGGGSYLGCPWDTLIKEYREAVKDTVFNSVHDVVPNFMHFLLQPRWGTDEEDQLSIVRVIVKELDEYARSFDDLIDEAEKQLKLDKLIASESEQFKESDPDFAIDKASFIDDFKPFIDRLTDDLFDFQLLDKQRKDLTDYLYEYVIRKEMISNHETGIVFCGFGKDEIYPVL